MDHNINGDDRAATIVTIIQSPLAGLHFYQIFIIYCIILPHVNNKQFRFNVYFLLGGATIHPYIGVSTFPERGDGIFWYNLLRSKDLDVHLTHKACPVILGAKWICNKWIGYYGQWKNEKQNCGLREDARFYPNFNGNNIPL